MPSDFKTLSLGLLLPISSGKKCMGSSLSCLHAQWVLLLSGSSKGKAQVRACSFFVIIIFISCLPLPSFLMRLASSNDKMFLIYIENCPDHIISFQHYYELHGEPVVLKCPSPRYKHLDFSSLTHNITWYKNDSKTMISGRGEDPRIWAKGDALWFLPARQEDSGVYVCTRR